MFRFNFLTVLSNKVRDLNSQSPSLKQPLVLTSTVSYIKYKPSNQTPPSKISYSSSIFHAKIKVINIDVIEMMTRIGSNCRAVYLSFIGFHTHHSEPNNKRRIDKIRFVISTRLYDLTPSISLMIKILSLLP
jgi:hypothetical protein